MIEKKLVIKFCETCNSRLSVWNTQKLCNICGFGLVSYTGQPRVENRNYNYKEAKNLPKEEFDLWVSKSSAQIRAQYKEYEKQLEKDENGFIFDIDDLEEPVIEELEDFDYDEPEGGCSDATTPDKQGSEEDKSFD